MIFKYVAFTLIVFCFSCNAPHIIKVCSLPKVLNESSGLINDSPNHFWSHNDSGGEPIVYAFDNSGKLLQTVRITNATNIDWEDAVIDKVGNLYIGDFGNNDQSRTKLTIYVVPNFESVQTLHASSVNKGETLHATSVQAQKIEFTYGDRETFPNDVAHSFFDAEAMLVRPDSIYIFTKDFFTKPYTGSTRIYSVPNKPGSYSAQFVHNFKTDYNSKWKGAITSAAQTLDGKTVALLAYRTIWVFSDFKNNNFWEGRQQRFDLKLYQLAQREGLCFSSTDRKILYMSSEKRGWIGGNLSKFVYDKTKTKIP